MGNRHLRKLLVLGAHAALYSMKSGKTRTALADWARSLLAKKPFNKTLAGRERPHMTMPVERFGWRFSPVERAMETQNDYDREVLNGDLIMVVRIGDEEGALIASFDGREVSYPFGELDTLVPTYATTIHKSQGAEYPAVIIPVATQHFTMLARNLQESRCYSDQRRADEAPLAGTTRAARRSLKGRNERFLNGNVNHVSEAH
jgi:exodeoxyribonuclease V alpha subunit